MKHLSICQTSRHPRVLLAFSMTCVLVAANAVAGTLQLRDSASLFSNDDRQHLQSEVSHYPFDVRVLTTTEQADQDAFNRYVAAQIAEPNMVVIGIDPTHRRTSVHFGTGTHIAHAEFTSIEHAGNTAFRQGQWHAGVAAILDHAALVVGTGAAARSEQAPTPTQQTYPSYPVESGQATRRIGSGCLLLGFVLLGGLALVLFLVRRRSASRLIPGATGPGMGGPLSSSGYSPPGGPPGYGPQGYGPQGYGGGPGYNPAYNNPNGGGLGRVGSGLVGAGLGGLAGYELGRAMGEREAEHRYPEAIGNEPLAVPDPPPSQGQDNRSWDAGGGSSDWDATSGDATGGGDFGGGGDAGGDGGSSDW